MFEEKFQLCRRKDLVLSGGPFKPLEGCSCPTPARLHTTGLFLCITCSRFCKVIVRCLLWASLKLLNINTHGSPFQKLVREMYT